MKKTILWTGFLATAIAGTFLTAIILKNQRGDIDEAKWNLIYDIKGYEPFRNNKIEKITLRKNITSPDWAAFSNRDLVSKWEDFFNETELKFVYGTKGSGKLMNGGGMAVAVISIDGKDYSCGLWRSAAGCMMELSDRTYITNKADCPFNETYDEAIARHGITTPWD